MILSVVTITFENFTGLSHTLESMACQSGLSDSFFSSFEHVIIDGGSEDGSVELIKDYANRVDYNVRWISERDRGIYNAMNKGTRMSAGNYLLFLNAGDTLADNHVLFNVFSYPLTGDVIIGRINVVSNSRILAKDGSIFGEKLSTYQEIATLYNINSNKDFKQGILDYFKIGD